MCTLPQRLHYYGDILPDHKNLKIWEVPGETIIRTIFKQFIGGVMKKRDRGELMTDGRSVGRSLELA
jgi:hypothetical protein